MIKDKIERIVFTKKGSETCSFQVTNESACMFTCETRLINEQISPEIEKLIVEFYRFGLQRGADLAVSEIVNRTDVRKIGGMVQKKVFSTVFRGVEQA